MKKIIIEFFKQNWIILFTALAILLFEHVAVAVTSGAFYIQKPWILFYQILLIISILYALKTQFSRFIVSIVVLVLYAFVDLIFIIIYEMTGQIFDYTMLELKNDAFGILESLPINVIYFFVCAILISAFIIFGGRYLRVYEKRVYKFNRNLVVKLGTIVMAGALLYLSISSQVSYRNYYDEMLYSNTDNTYKKMGITSNFISQMYEASTKKNDKEMDELELTSYLYDDNQIKLSNFKENYDKKYNVITILCESFEWMSFIADEKAFPNGLKLKDPTGQGRSQRELSQELFPNLHRFMSDSTVFANFHSKEKTDISENYSYLGVYPTASITNYDFAQNTISLSMANTLKALDKDIKCNIFHNGTNSFYNREIYERTVGFDNFYAYNELLKKDNFTDCIANGERNLDSELISCFADEIMPIDSRFYSYIITITGHGQYSYRKSLGPYYDKLSEYGISFDKTKDFTDIDNAFITYAATSLEVDKMIGCLYDELEERGLLDKTVITLFGDHNCYYQGLSNYVKKLPENFHFIADGYSAYPLAAQQFFREFGDKFKFDITQVIGLTNDDEVSRVFRPYKQMIERLNRTYKVSYRPTNGFDNIDGANYDLALWVAYYNFLRPHKHAGCKVLNKVEMLEGAENMPGKWQLLIFLGQQTILNLQNQASA